RANPSDVLRQTFLQACRDFAQCRGSTEAELLAWLRRILVHNLGQLVEKQVRAQKRDVRREVSLEQRLAGLERSSARVENALVSRFSSPSAQARNREQAALPAAQLARRPA